MPDYKLAAGRLRDPGNFNNKTRMAEYMEFRSFGEFQVDN